MGKDEELLLGLEKSDSDDVVEEFKLPPSRGRRKRKHIPEARVATGGSPLVTWKCCFSFFVLSLLISGALILAYFIYNMHVQLYVLKHNFENGKDHANAIFDSYTKKIKEMELRQQTFNIFQAQHTSDYEKLSSTIQDLVNKQNEQSKDNFVHNINTLQSDVEAIKNDMAKNVAEFEKTQRYMLSMEEKFRQLQKDFNAIKVEAINPTNSQLPQSGTYGGDSVYMTKSQVNAMFKKFEDGQVDENADRTKATLSELADLKAQYKEVNVTHNFDLLRLTQSVVQIKKEFEAYKVSYEPVIAELKNATRDVFKQLNAHKTDVTDLEDEIKAINETVTNMRQQITLPSTSVTLTVRQGGLIKGDKTTPTNPQITAEATTTATKTEEKSAGVSSTVKTSASPVNQKLSKTPPAMSDVGSSTAPQNNGPMLPNESKMHRTNPTAVPKHVSTAKPVVADVTAKTTEAHVYSITLKVTKEQTAKNESEIDYKKFQSTAANMEIKQNNPENSDNSDSGDSESRRRTLSQAGDRNINYEQLSGSFNRQPSIPYSPSGNLYEGSGEGTGDVNDEDVRRMMTSDTGNLSQSQKRELLQKFLTAKGNTSPYNSGDKRK